MNLVKLSLLKDVKLGNSLESNMILEVLYRFVLLFDPQLITPGLELIPPLKSVVSRNTE